MKPDPRTAVIDFGKTHTRFEIFQSGQSVFRQQIVTPHCTRNGLQYEDTAKTEAWLRSELPEHTPDIIVPVAHGAAYAAVDLTANDPVPILDYMEVPPEEVRQDYAMRRPPFSQTGSPSLDAGLNLGQQIFWQDRTSNTSLLPLAQYWAWRLSGEARSEMSSLGCHTDLWDVTTNDWSNLAKTERWDMRFAPFAAAGDRLGSCQWHGLENVDVLCGVHDSNAALIALRRSQPEADIYISTGTWHVAVAPGADVQPPEDADGLINISPYGERLPSMRYMGGEIRTRLGGSAISDPDTIRDIIQRGAYLDAPVIIGSGPFAARKDHASSMSALKGTEIADLHSAMIWTVMIDQLKPGAKTIVIEGPAASGLTPRLLQAFRPDLAISVAPDGVSAALGGACLADVLCPVSQARPVEPLRITGLSRYYATWTARMETMS